MPRRGAGRFSPRAALLCRSSGASCLPQERGRVLPIYKASGDRAVPDRLHDGAPSAASAPRGWAIAISAPGTARGPAPAPAIPASTAPRPNSRNRATALPKRRNSPASPVGPALGHAQEPGSWRWRPCQGRRRRGGSGSMPPPTRITVPPTPREAPAMERPDPAGRPVQSGWKADLESALTWPMAGSLPPMPISPAVFAASGGSCWASSRRTAADDHAPPDLRHLLDQPVGARGPWPWPPARGGTGRARRRPYRRPAARGREPGRTPDPFLPVRSCPNFAPARICGGPGTSPRRGAVHRPAGLGPAGGDRGARRAVPHRRPAGGGKWPHTLAIQPGGVTRAPTARDKVRIRRRPARLSPVPGGRAVRRPGRGFRRPGRRRGAGPLGRRRCRAVPVDRRGPGPGRAWPRAGAPDVLRRLSRPRGHGLCPGHLGGGQDRSRWTPATSPRT